jgi:hypothetical protein
VKLITNEVTETKRMSIRKRCSALKRSEMGRNRISGGHIAERKEMDLAIKA